MANEKAVVDTIPTLETTRNNEPKMKGSPAPSKIITSSDAPPSEAIIRPLTKSLLSLIRPASLPVICPAM